MSTGAAPGPPADDAPTRAARWPPGGGPARRARGRVSPGPLASLVLLTTRAAPTASSGATLRVTTEVVVLSDGPRVVAHPQTSALEVLRDDVVVARSVGSDGPDVPTPVRKGRVVPAQTVPAEVALVDVDGKPLPPGHYRLRALLGYGSDPLNTGPGPDGGDRWGEEPPDAVGSFVLPSEPVDLTVT